MGTAVKTLAERKAEAAARKMAAVASLRQVLAAAAPELGGRFLLYGSAARGEMRYDSDVDLLLDFPDATLGCAWDVVESACARLGLAPDIRPVSLCSERFLAHVMAEAEAIG